MTCYEEESDFLAGKMVEMGLAEEDKAVVLSWIWQTQRALTVCPWLGDFSSTLITQKKEDNIGMLDRDQYCFSHCLHLL